MDAMPGPSHLLRVLVVLGLLTATALGELQSDRLVILKHPDGALETFRAAKLSVSELVVLARSADGKRKAWPRQVVLGILPILPDDPQTISDKQIDGTIAEYTEALEQYPGLHEVLTVELDSWRAILDDRRERLEKRLAEFLAVEYDPATAYTRERIREMQDAGRALLEHFPDRAAAIEIKLQQWDQHHAKPVATANNGTSITRNQSPQWLRKRNRQ
jgi:hypothetical protein